MNIEDLKKETKAMGDKIEQSVEERIDRLEEALGVINHMLHFVKTDNVAYPSLLKQFKRIYFETPQYIKMMKESRERIENMIEEDK